MAIGLREKLTGYGLFLGALSAILTAAKLYAVAAGLVLWLTATLIAAFWIEDTRRHPRLKRLFAPRRIGALYRRMTIRVARWPRDWRLYDKALLIAVVYPIGIPLVLWIYPGKAASLGGVEVLPAPDAAWQQVMVGGLICLHIFALIQSATARTKGSEWKFWLWLIVALAFAGAFAGALAFSGAVALAVVGAGAVALAESTERGFGNAAYIALTSTLLAVLFGTLTAVSWNELNDEIRVTFLFLGLLPLVNAVFDYVSYSVTLWLLRAGVRKPRIALLTGLCDLAVAALLFLALGAALVVMIASINQWADVPLYPLVPLFHGIRLAPDDYLWLYLMMFSTILPTVLHAAVATFSLGSWLTIPARRALYGMIDDPDALPAAAAPLLIGLYWTACLLVPLILCYGLYLLGQTYVDAALDAYLRVLESIACHIGPASCPA